MWMMNTIGFFSVTDAGSGNVQLRARCKEDAQALVSSLRGLSRRRFFVSSTPHADYPFRVFIPRDLFAKWMHDQAMKIDYTNFKDEVAKKDPERSHGAYLEVWSVLRKWLDPRVRGALQSAGLFQRSLGAGAIER